jgi:hypothetical protein
VQKQGLAAGALIVLRNSKRKKGTSPWFSARGGAPKYSFASADALGGRDRFAPLAAQCTPICTCGFPKVLPVGDGGFPSMMWPRVQCGDSAHARHAYAALQVLHLGRQRATRHANNVRTTCGRQATCEGAPWAERNKPMFGRALAADLNDLVT